MPSWIGTYCCRSHTVHVGLHLQPRWPVREDTWNGSDSVFSRWPLWKSTIAPGWKSFITSNGKQQYYFNYYNHAKELQVESILELLATVFAREIDSIMNTDAQFSSNTRQQITCRNNNIDVSHYVSNLAKPIAKGKGESTPKIDDDEQSEALKASKSSRATQEHDGCNDGEPLALSDDGNYFPRAMMESLKCQWQHQQCGKHKGYCLMMNLPNVQARVACHRSRHKWGSQLLKLL